MILKQQREQVLYTTPLTTLKQCSLQVALTRYTRVCTTRLSVDNGVGKRKLITPVLIVVSDILCK